MERIEGLGSSRDARWFGGEIAFKWGGHVHTGFIRFRGGNYVSRFSAVVQIIRRLEQGRTSY